MSALFSKLPMKKGLPSWFVPDGTCKATGVVNDSSTAPLLEGNIIRSISNKIKINNSFHILFIRLKFIIFWKRFENLIF